MADGKDYAEAIRKVEKHLREEPDGTISITGSADEIGIDPTIFDDLKRSVEQTNENVRAGHYRVGDSWSGTITTDENGAIQVTWMKDAR